MSPVLLFASFAFAGPEVAPTATPAEPTTVAAAPAPAAATTAPEAAPAAPRAHSGHRVGASAPAPALVYGPAPAPVAAPAPEAAPAPAAALPSPALAVEPPVDAATPAASLSPDAALSLRDAPETPTAPATASTPSVLDTMPAPALEALPTGTSMPSTGWAWPAVLAGVGLVAAWQLRKRALGVQPSTLSVVQRHALGDKSTLLVVDVIDGDGATRRLLVGSSPTGLSLIENLGAVNTAAESHPATPAQLSLSDFGDLEPTTTLPRAEGFASLLDEVLEERGVVPTDAPDARAPRFFDPEDLAPVAEPPAAELPRAARRKGHLRGRFTSHAPGWSPQVEAYLPPPPDVTPVKDTIEPVVEPVRRGAAALLARAPVVNVEAKKAGMSALVKARHPAPDAEPAGPSLVVLPKDPHAGVKHAPPVVVTAPAVAIPPEPTLPAAVEPAPARAVYVSPTMSQPVSKPDRRIVGPPLRDARLTAPTPAPRLRLAEPRPSGATEEPIPPVRELVDRLLAQQAEAPKLAANGTPAGGAIKNRFQAIVARETGR